MDIQSAIGWVVLVFIAALEVAIIYLIVIGKIDLSRLISEPTGDASMSRFQLLIFTFVIALSLFLIVTSGAEKPKFPDVIPPGVLTLLGISASSYLVSKGIQFSRPEGVEEKAAVITVVPPHPTVPPGTTVQFAVNPTGGGPTNVKWEVVPPGVGAIDPKTGVYTAPAVVPPGMAIVTVRAVSVTDASTVGTALVSFS